MMENGGTENECDESFRQLARSKETRQRENTKFFKGNEEVLGILFDDASSNCYSDHQ